MPGLLDLIDLGSDPEALDRFLRNDGEDVRAGKTPMRKIIDVPLPPARPPEFSRDDPREVERMRRQMDELIRRETARPIPMPETMRPMPGYPEARNVPPDGPTIRDLNAYTAQPLSPGADDEDAMERMLRRQTYQDGWV